MSAPEQRLPLAPLLRAAGLERVQDQGATVRDVTAHDTWTDYNATGRPVVEYARGWEYVAGQLGTTGRTLHRWAELGGVPLSRCDAAAVAVGRVPEELWGQEWWDALAQLDQDRERAKAERARAQRRRRQEARERHGSAA